MLAFMWATLKRRANSWYNIGMVNLMMVQVCVLLCCCIIFPCKELTRMIQSPESVRFVPKTVSLNLTIQSVYMHQCWSWHSNNALHGSVKVQYADKYIKYKWKAWVTEQVALWNSFLNKRLAHMNNKIARSQKGIRVIVPVTLMMMCALLWRMKMNALWGCTQNLGSFQRPFWEQQYLANVESLPTRKKCALLIIDEMTIRENLEHDKSSDELVG